MASLADRLFPGTGEVAGIIRATDWSKTPLGSIESWPQSLRTAVSICLGSRHPIVLWWGPSRWMFYNDAYRPMLGETKHPQFLGRPGHECWSEIWDIIGPMMDEVTSTGEATWSEDMFLLMRRSGYPEETYFTFSYSPIRDEDGKVNGIFNACTESTARVLDRRRLKTLRAITVDARAVGDAARLCATLLGQNPHDIPFALLYLTDPSGARLELAGHAGLAPGTAASPTAVDLAVQTDAWPLARVVENGQPETVDDLQRRFDGLPTAPWDAPPERAMLLPIARAGAEKPAGVLVLGVSPRRVLDDDYRGFFDLVAGHVATVIANARAYEEARIRAEVLAEVDRAKTAFFSNVSHEFRTPLTLMLGPLEDALGDPAGALAGDDLRAVHRNALRLLKLVNSVLDFSRIEANRLTSRFEPTDLAFFTRGLAGSFLSLLESAGLKLVVDCPPIEEPVYVDRSQWEKIVNNLLSNAFKFTFEGQIAVRLRVVGDGIELSVSDTGTGIPSAALPRIFERFHRVDGAKGRSFEGTGIGLALVHELVNQHGGGIRVESVVGKGTTFFVTIPRGKDHLPADRTAASGVIEDTGGTAHLFEASQWLRSDAHVVAAPSSSARVLVADDNADMRAYLARLLAPRWVVEVVEDGRAALESALERPPDLVLSDVMMPRMDGVALLRELRADARTRTVPVVLLSARAGEESVVAGLETGADDYLVKPFSARELLTRVAAHLEMSRVRRIATDAANELAATRAALLEDVQRRNRELDAFSYSVSHDLRAPLRAIDGFSQALLEDHAAQLDSEGQLRLHRVRAAAKRMGELIDDLLELSRVERAELRRAPVDVSKVARKVGESLAKAEPSHAVELIVRDGLVAEADARLVAIVLENLLGNAWKFTKKAARPRVELDASAVDGQTTFCVRDNGAGFDPAYSQRLFTPFHRLHKENDFPGTGIGLATVRRIVERHGGSVWAEGEVGRGAAIYFTLPVARATLP